MVHGKGNNGGFVNGYRLDFPPMKKQLSLLFIMGCLGWCGPVFAGDANTTTNRLQIRKDTPADAYASMELLTEAMMMIKRYYVEDEDYAQITAGALQGMLQALDEHSTFLEESPLSNLKEETTGKYAGIGAQIGMRDGLLIIISPFEGTPAFKAGLQSGDKILELEGKETKDMRLDEAVKMMRGEKGSKIKLSILKQGTSSPIDIVLTREIIDIPTVKDAKIIKDGTAYVRLTQFAENTADMLKSALERLDKEGMNSIILDLRSNHGGLLDSSVKVSSLFLEKDKVVVTTKGRPDVSKPDVRKSVGDKRYVDIPMAVLVDNFSASAAEIVAGALKDQKRAVIVGATTYGKGSVQNVITMSANPKTAIKLTTAYYYTPSGLRIHEKGIDPDIRTYLPPEEWRRVMMKAMMESQPGSLNEAEKKECATVVDYPLQRAFDLLQGLKVYKTGDSSQ